MSDHLSASPAPPKTQSVAREACTLVRRGLKATLATLDRETGAPYASLVTVATDAAGAPTLLISRLARHTQNLLADPRSSILFDGTDAAGDPLAGGRVTVIGHSSQTSDPGIRRRFLARHPEAEGYADFPDFSFWRLEPETAHFIGGFGRIFTLPGAEILTDVTGAEDLIEAELGILAHMAEDHADATELYATRLLGGRPGPWRMVGCDPEGCDLVLEGETLRLDFPNAVRTPGDVRKAMVELATRARAG